MSSSERDVDPIVAARAREAAFEKLWQERLVAPFTKKYPTLPLYDTESAKFYVRRAVRFLLTNSVDGPFTEQAAANDVQVARDGDDVKFSPHTGGAYAEMSEVVKSEVAKIAPHKHVANCFEMTGKIVCGFGPTKESPISDVQVASREAAREIADKVMDHFLMVEIDELPHRRDITAIIERGIATALRSREEVVWQKAIEIAKANVGNLDTQLAILQLYRLEAAKAQSFRKEK